MSESQEELELTRCPEIIEFETKKRCNQVAEILGRVVLRSTDGPMEHAQTQCLDGHTLFLPTEMLDVEKSDEYPAEPTA